MAVNRGNQLVCGFVDGFQTVPQFFQFFALRPCSDIAKAVIASLDAEILAHRIGNAFGFYFLRMPAFLFGRLGSVTLHGSRVLLIIVQQCMSDFMHHSGDGLNLTHPSSDGNALAVQVKKAIGIRFNGKNRNRDGRSPAQGFHKGIELLHIAGQITGKMGQRLSVRLTDIKNLHRLEHGDFNGLFLHDNLAICIQHGSLGIRVKFLFLHLFSVGRRGNNGNAVFTTLHMAFKLVTPFVVTGYQRSIRPLHIDQHGVVDRIAVEPGHYGQVLPVLFTFKQFLDALLNALGYFPQTVFIGLFLFCHGCSLLS